MLYVLLDQLSLPFYTRCELLFDVIIKIRFMNYLLIAYTKL